MVQQNYEYNKYDAQDEVHVLIVLAGAHTSARDRSASHLRSTAYFTLAVARAVRDELPSNFTTSHPVSLLLAKEC